MTYQEWLEFLRQYQQENPVYNSSYTGLQIDSAVGQVLGDTVIKNTAQTLTDAQKAQARSNIGAADDEEISCLKSAKAPVIIDTASGAIASFEDGADDMPLKSLTVNIEPVQEGSGDPAPDNVRPITGWTGCNIHVSPTTTGGTVYTVFFPTEAGTVYGGTLTINADGTGELVVDWVKVLVSETWSTGWTYAGNVGTPYFEHATNVNIEKRILSLCNKYKYGTPSGNSMADMSFGVLSSGKGIRFRNSNYTNVTDFVASLSGVEVVIPLAQDSPAIRTHHLTIEQVTTLLGTNNVWADCGDVKVEYPADTKLYIQKINAPTDDDMTADTQIASGKYFLIGNTLYLSTTIIPAGDIIIPGTNCTKTNLAAALNALNA